MTFDYEARHIIEALRSGIPSRAVGQYFSEARPQIMHEIIQDLEAVRGDGKSGGRIISGKYGEGKTHLLNTVFNIAHANHMVVSIISLSKETPFDKLYLVYQKLVNSTYLPKRLQPGFMQELDQLTPNSPLTNDLLLFAAKQLETDSLYHILRAYVNTDDQDEKFLLQTDLEGDFVPNLQIKQICRRIFDERIAFQVNFVKSKHYLDYFSFLSHLFMLLGYKGWIILFDETELMGRLGKKTRLKAYQNMANFLYPHKQLESTYSLFAISASYGEDVIESKHEYESVKESFSDEEAKPLLDVLGAIRKAPQLAPLTTEEINEILLKLVQFHGRAYNWEPKVSVAQMMKTIDSGGHLLRTKIRSSIEYLDQLYQYGNVGQSSVRSLDKERFEEDMPSLDSILE
jgi:hypothetical protein